MFAVSWARRHIFGMPTSERGAGKRNAYMRFLSRNRTDSRQSFVEAVIYVSICLLSLQRWTSRQIQLRSNKRRSSTYQTSTDIHTHRSSNPISTATAFPISQRPKHLFLVVSLLLLKRLARRRWLYPVVAIMQLDPLGLRVRRWNTLIRNNSSEVAAITGAWGNGCKMLVEAGKNDETAAEQTEGNFGDAIE